MDGSRLKNSRGNIGLKAEEECEGGAFVFTVRTQCEKSAPPVLSKVGNASALHQFSVSHSVTCGAICH